MSSEKLCEFRVGEKAVYPCHGVGTIEKIEACSVGGLDQDFYVLKIHATGARVMVPTGAAKTVGLRSVVDGYIVEKVYQILRSPSAKKSTSTWNRRYRALTDKLNGGNLVEIAEVLRDLSSLSSNKELSYGEKRMLEKARNMLVAEISIARQEETSVIELELNKILYSL